ncbi:RAD52 family DNA repair protein [Nocardia sp. CDC159]|uniref:RAD52 family DNA repair protein n=1 Tax=Nocardia pulmonis TaxID=2951408 RepID=A0A9X2E8H3_9NOCA|nr:MULTISPECIES: Rad52/Rad22 family DNA repair protein [Nocardia]MCM6776247.1 RAD52 family DNA repair protein [Nocardia pulmonis]MCM6788427.1 RAD52 family DNA repair protein [Nocardia sp. CDC159]
MRLNLKQITQLLKPIHPNRVLKDGKGHAHVSQQDITAHLIRVFGFGNFDTDVRYVELVFEEPRVNKQGEPSGRWDACYRAMVRLTVKDPHGNELAHYEDGSTATAQNQTRGDAHDLAFKSAISLAKKRAAINLGDQFGLSLYNKGQLSALVMGTLVMPDQVAEDAPTDMQDGVEKQVSLGNDEIDREDGDE